MKKFIINLFSVLSLVILHKASATEQLEWPKYKQVQLSKLNTIEGWCPHDKADRMMDLIHDTHPEVCVEIGVYGGSSIFPTASALRYNNKGIVYAIDPWKNADCIEATRSDDPNYTWWNSVDLEQIYKGFINMLKKQGLQKHCHVMRMTASEALTNFADESIDILHIDGNHNEETAYRDAVQYLAKVKKGGYIWFDDVHWYVMVDGKPHFTTYKAINYLLQYCTLHPTSKMQDPYILMQKN